jgi:hypothetical protein
VFFTRQGYKFSAIKEGFMPQEGPAFPIGDLVVTGSRPNPDAHGDGWSL